MSRKLHALFGGHVDAGELDGIAAGSALHRDVVSGVSRHFVLIVDGVDLLVRVVDEHVFGAVFLDALGRAFAGLGVSALDAALAVGNPAGPAAIGGHGQSCGKQGRCGNGCKSNFHFSPSRKLLRLVSCSGFASEAGKKTRNPEPGLDSPKPRPLAWHRAARVSRTSCVNTVSRPSWMRCHYKKEKGDSCESPRGFAPPRRGTNSLSSGQDLQSKSLNLGRKNLLAGSSAGIFG